MMIIDVVDFRSRVADARLVSVAGETIVAGRFDFTEAATTLANIRQEVRPQILVLRDARKLELERLATEAGQVDAT